jgi:multidrug efflux system membrane fusion protein
VPVTTATVITKSMPVEIGVIGSAEPFSTVSIRSQTTGQLTAVNFTEGQEVTKGQLLFSLDRRPLEAAVEQAQANLTRDEAQAANAPPWPSGIRTWPIAASLRASRPTRRGRRWRRSTPPSPPTRPALENAKVQLEYATINAPITGQTGALMVHEGNLVRANDSTPLVVINQIMPIQVAFSIPEARLAELKRFMAQGSLRVLASPPTTRPRRRPAASPSSTIRSDPTTGTIKVKGTFPNADRRLWPGQFVNVTVGAHHREEGHRGDDAGRAGGAAGPVRLRRQAGFHRRTAQRGRDALRRRRDGDCQRRRAWRNGGDRRQLRLVPGSRISVKTQDPRSDTTRSGD